MQNLRMKIVLCKKKQNVGVPIESGSMGAREERGSTGDVLARPPPTLHPIFPVHGHTRPRRHRTTPRPCCVARTVSLTPRQAPASDDSFWKRSFGCWRGTCSAGAWGPRRSTSTVTLGLALLGRALFGFGSTTTTHVFR